MGIFLPQIGKFAFPPRSPYSDLLISHLPNLVYLKTALVNYHEIPLWSSAILSGYPFAANPLSGLWYFPTWLLLVTPQPVGFNLLVLAHVFFGGLGLYRFLRTLGLTPLAALSGGLSFVLMPKIWGHFGAGHVSLLFAFSWTPWLLLAESKAFTAGAPWQKIAPGIAWGMTVLADVRWAFYSGLLWMCFSAFEFAAQLDFAGFKERGIDKGLFKKIAGWAGASLVKVIAGLGVSAPLLVPLFEFTRLSTRSSLLPEDTLTLSLPPSHFAGLLIPDFSGYFEWVLYPGVVTCLSLLLILANKSLRRKSAFWIGVILVSLIFALGKNAEVIVGITRILPGFGLLRVPARVLFLSGMSFSILLGIFVHHLAQQPEVKINSWGKRLLFLITALLGMLGGGLWVVTGEPPLGYVWSFLVALAFLVVLFLRDADRLSRTAWCAAVISLVVLDLGTTAFTLVRFSPVEELIDESSKAAGYVQAQGGVFRTYSPSYSIPQHVAADHGLELADGIDPLQIRAYTEFFRTASGVPQPNYSVTLPPFAAGDPATDNRMYRPDAKLLGILNVRFVVAGFDMAEEGLILRARFGEVRVYENLFFRPRVWLESRGGPEDVKASSEVVILQRTANTIEVQAGGPGSLVFSEVGYPGWTAFVDGVKTEIGSSYGLLRAVEIPEGLHNIKMVFRPASVTAGVVIALLTWFLFLFLRVKK